MAAASQRTPEGHATGQAAGISLLFASRFNNIINTLAILGSVL